MQFRRYSKWGVMLHLFTFEDHEPSVLDVVFALILAIPFCLVWMLMLAVGRKQRPVTSGEPAYACAGRSKHIAGKAA